MLDYPLANVVHRLRFPPYCYHKFQSLDYVVYGLFKSIITVCVTTEYLAIPCMPKRPVLLVIHIMYGLHPKCDKNTNWQCLKNTLQEASIAKK